MEDTLQFFYFEKPYFETFKNWISKRQKNENSESEDLTENVLSEEDLQFWAENGYVVVKNVITKKECEETEKAVWEYLQMNPDQKESWYNRHEDQKGLMLNFSDHATLNKNRFSPKIKKAYEQLYNTTQIYKTIDKVSFNPPETENFTSIVLANERTSFISRPFLIRVPPPAAPPGSPTWPRCPRSSAAGTPAAETRRRANRRRPRGAQSAWSRQGCS